MESATFTFEKIGDIEKIEDILDCLDASGERQSALHNAACKARESALSKDVYFRGIIEFSNLCDNDCLYCGIRKSNDNVQRYSMTKEQILGCVDFCHKAGYGSVVLQSGELHAQAFSDFVEDVIIEIKARYPGMGITLSLGEHKTDVYRKWFRAGASKYLMRIETSNKGHYEKLHPKEMSFENRKSCLAELRKIGFHVGTGVMIGSPFQTTQDLARDLLFFKELDVDMVGMGPYIPCDDAPLGQLGFDREKNLNLALNMIAILRLMMPDINIAATTALQALRGNGRELGLLAGANVIMPIVTPVDFRKNYQLYRGKPCIEESSEDCMNCVTGRIRSVGLNPAFNVLGDSRHYLKRVDGKGVSNGQQ